MVQPTLLQETVQLTLSLETMQPSLSQDSIPATPQTTLPDGSPVPIVTAVIVVTPFVIVLGVVVLLIIFIRAKRKRQKLLAWCCNCTKSCNLGTMATHGNPENPNHHDRRS